MFHLATGRDSPLFRFGFHSHTWRVHTKHTKPLALRQRLWAALAFCWLCCFCFSVSLLWYKHQTNKQTTPAIQMRHKGDGTGKVNRPPESSDTPRTPLHESIFYSADLRTWRSKTCSSKQSDPIRSDPIRGPAKRCVLRFISCPQTQGATSDGNASDEEIELKSVLRSCCCQATQLRAS